MRFNQRRKSNTLAAFVANTAQKMKFSIFFFFFLVNVTKSKGNCGNPQQKNAKQINKEKELEAETVSQMCSVKKVFLKISQNLQENTCTRVSFLIKLQT